MNRLEELIQQLCPDGVEYKKFENVCQYIRGITYNKAQEAKVNDTNPWKVMRANNITLGTNVLNFEDIKLVKREVKVKKNQLLQKGDILICAGSGSKEHIGKVAYIFDDMDYTFGGFMAVIRCDDKLNSKFLFHILTGSSFSMYLGQALNSTTINNLNAGLMKNFFIPIPPLKVQQEVVRVLDQFMELISELTIQLTAELTTRKKQYEYYRDELLHGRSFCDVRECKLGEVADIHTGNKPDEILEENTEFEYINAGTTNSGYAKASNCPGDTVTTPSRGQGGIGFVGYQSQPFYLGPLCYSIRSSNENIIMNKFIYYWLSSHTGDILAFKKEGGTPALNRGDLMEIRLCIPHISVQHRIISILDRFDALCNDLTSGLSAEIEARRKQYEYYRDKLLTFKKLEA